ncbi:Deoxyuridine 5'-triphosphate nucleotidohydrolase [Termitomyces sp. J132]|nr:Deoxyuridine 5'-triphosphate nucleotidohydrolase [Termitomyces sp. J132]
MRTKDVLVISILTRSGISTPTDASTPLDDYTTAQEEKKCAPEASLAPTSNLLIKRHPEKARVLSRGSPLALLNAEDKIIPAHGKALIDTQISIVVPAGTYGRVAPRSEFASRFMIDTGAGVIDADYRGIVFVLLFNLSDKDFGVKEGDRIAQLIVERIYTPEILEVKDLDETLRGPGGFGSTGGHNNLDVSSS